MRILVIESNRESNNSNRFLVEVADDFNRPMERYVARSESHLDRDNALMAAKYLSVELAAPVFVKTARSYRAKQLR